MCACGKEVFRLPSGTWLSTERPGKDDRVHCAAQVNAETRRHTPIAAEDPS